MNWLELGYNNKMKLIPDFRVYKCEIIFLNKELRLGMGFDKATDSMLGPWAITYDELGLTQGGFHAQCIICSPEPGKGDVYEMS